MIIMKVINNFNGIEEINPNEVRSILGVWESKVLVMKVATSNEGLYYFPTLTAMQIHICNEFIRSLNLLPNEYVYFKTHEQYENLISCIGSLIKIKSVLLEESIVANPYNIYSMMIDGFNDKNLLKKAEHEQNFKKYVFMAVEKHQKDGE